MKAITMLLAGFLVLSFVSTANARGKPGPVDLVDCAYFDGTHTAHCGEALSLLCSAIDVAGPDFGSLNESDRDTMISKTIGADIKLEQDKGGEADEKLFLIQLKLLSLAEARKPKINKPDFDLIADALCVAQDCGVGTCDDPVEFP